jgi:predicted metal-dependent RNase
LRSTGKQFVFDELKPTVEITAFAAGHTLGGAVWRIKVGTDEIVYCSHYNHANERHLDKGVMGTLQRSAALPTEIVCLTSLSLSRPMLLILG